MNSRSNAHQSMPEENASTAPRATLLDLLNNRIGVLHKITDELHQLADRVVGIRDNLAPQVAKAVPNGLLEEVVDSADRLEDRLHGLHERLSRV